MIEVGREQRGMSYKRQVLTLLKQRLRKLFTGRALPAVDSAKILLLEAVFSDSERRVDSFADLGGVWGIDAAYTFYLLETYDIAQAFLVDTDFTDAVLAREKGHPNLLLLKANFGDPSVPERIGKAGAVILFDVLLHQVSPDWDEILEMYASIADVFVIFNQQIVGEAATIRLLDRNEQWYRENVPYDEHDPGHRDLFRRMYEIHPQHGRTWRDIHNVWQWGITDEDLCAKMRSLGFERSYFKSHGQFGRWKLFENHAFVFRKSESRQHGC